MGLQASNHVLTPVASPHFKLKPDDKPLDSHFSTKYRQLVARANFIDHGNVDVQYAVYELANGMSAPLDSSRARLKRLAKYLGGRPRYVNKFLYQRNVFGINGRRASDCSKDPKTRTSTSGWIVCIGDHVSNAWS